VGKIQSDKNIRTIYFRTFTDESMLLWVVLDVHVSNGVMDLMPS
jgi:hypothetical protein